MAASAPVAGHATTGRRPTSGDVRRPSALIRGTEADAHTAAAFARAVGVDGYGDAHRRFATIGHTK